MTDEKIFSFFKTRLIYPSTIYRCENDTKHFYYGTIKDALLLLDPDVYIASDRTFCSNFPITLFVIDENKQQHWIDNTLYGKLIFDRIQNKELLKDILQDIHNTK